MTKKLYRVEVSHNLYVLAESEEAAERDAEAAFRHYPGECGDPDSIATMISNFASVPDEWKDSLPFGDDTAGERTIRQILEVPNAKEG